MSTTICCLLYGNYTKLADRCLRPISELYNNGVEVRLGCNETSQETDELISQLFPSSDRLIIKRHNPQIYKYPVMRELFNARPITTDKVMWFDDDSYIKDTNPIGWLNSTQEFMDNTCTTCRYRINNNSGDVSTVRGLSLSCTEVRLALLLEDGGPLSQRL